MTADRTRARGTLDALMMRVAAAGRGGRPRVLAPVPAPVPPARVSVVVPCYNYGHYLARCVASILDQPGVDVDVLIIDDASPDGSGDVARDLAARHPRVRAIVHETNKRHIATYNEGLAQVTGEYVVLLSADDLLAPGSLGRAVALMSAHPSVGLVYGPAPMFSEEPPPQVREEATAWLVWQGADWLHGRCITGHNAIRCPEAVMRTSVLREVGEYRADLPHGADFAMWMAAAGVSDIGYVAGIHQGYYRQHAANMSRTTYQLGSPQGLVRDLEEKRLCFDTTLDAATTEGRQLLAVAHRALAEQALRVAVRSYVWGVADQWPIADIKRFAFETYRDAPDLALWQALERRERIGSRAARRHPRLVPREIEHRLVERADRWRFERAGI